MDTNNNGKDELPDQSKASKKGRSCKGTLYYSSALKSKAYNPLCVGIPRAIPEVPQSIVAETEIKASIDDRHLTEFRYACAGYSVYLDRITKDHSKDNQNCPFATVSSFWLAKEWFKRYLLPLLFLPMFITNGDLATGKIIGSGKQRGGLYYMSPVQRTPVSCQVSHPSNLWHMRLDDHEVPQTQRQQPTQSAGSLFFNRFTRNADLVASGVTKNIRKVGKYVKGSIYEFLYSYRGRPK